MVHLGSMICAWTTLLLKLNALAQGLRRVLQVEGASLAAIPEFKYTAAVLPAPLRHLQLLRHRRADPVLLPLPARLPRHLRMVGPVGLPQAGHFGRIASSQLYLGTLSLCLARNGLHPSC